MGMSRGAVSKKNSRLVGIWMPHTIDEAVNHAVTRLDLDRSKFIRIAVREKLARVGIAVPEEVAK